MPHQALEYLRNRLKEREQELTAHISSGAVQDFAQYREVCGKLTGLAMAQRELQDVRDMLRKANGDID